MLSLNLNYYLHTLLNSKHLFLIQLAFFFFFYSLFFLSPTIFCMYEGGDITIVPGTGSQPQSMVEQLREKIEEQKNRINDLEQQLIIYESMIKDTYCGTSELSRVFDIISEPKEQVESKIESVESKEALCNIDCGHCEDLYKELVAQKAVSDQEQG